MLQFQGAPAMTYEVVYPNGHLTGTRHVSLFACIGDAHVGIEETDASAFDPVRFVPMARGPDRIRQTLIRLVPALDPRVAETGLAVLAPGRVRKIDPILDLDYAWVGDQTAHPTVAGGFQDGPCRTPPWHTRCHSVTLAGAL